MASASDPPGGPDGRDRDQARVVDRSVPDPRLPAVGAADRRRILAAAYVAEADAVYTFIVRRVGSVADAEDLTADTFLRALRGRSILDPSRVRGLLFTIARAVLAEHWARLYSEAPTPVGTLDQAPDGGPEGLPGSDADPDRLDRALDRRVTAVLASLPDNYRRVLELRFLEGCSVRETAKQMGLRPGNVRVLQMRALRRAAGLGSVLP